MPTSTPLTLHTALVCTATAWISSPILANAKSPLRRTIFPRDADRPFTITIEAPATTDSGALIEPTVSFVATDRSVSLKVTVTFPTDTAAKDAGNFRIGRPEACNCTPPPTGKIMAKAAAVTPNSTSPELNTTLALWATTWMSSPAFAKAKSPRKVSKFPTDAFNPVTVTIAVLAATTSGALIEPIFNRVSTEIAVSL